MPLRAGQGSLTALRVYPAEHGAPARPGVSVAFRKAQVSHYARRPIFRPQQRETLSTCQPLLPTTRQAGHRPGMEAPEGCREQVAQGTRSRFCLGAVSGEPQGSRAQELIPHLRWLLDATQGPRQGWVRGGLPVYAEDRKCRHPGGRLCGRRQRQAGDPPRGTLRAAPPTAILTGRRQGLPTSM